MSHLALNRNPHTGISPTPHPYLDSLYPNSTLHTNFILDIITGSDDGGLQFANLSDSDTGNFTISNGFNESDTGTQDQSGESALYEVPLWITVGLSTLYGTISITTLVGNLLVLWVVAVSRRMRTVTNMFIANLAVADIIIGLFTIPFQFQAALLQRWDLPKFLCAFCPFIQVLSVNISVFTLSAIALDRYRAVLYPLSARVSKRKASWAILTIWTVGLGLAVPTQIDYEVTDFPENGKSKPFCSNVNLSETVRMYYTLILVVIQYIFPLIIISVAYAHMATKLWGTTAPGNKEESRDAIVLRNKKKVIKMLAVVVLVFAFCWIPLQTYNFVQTLAPAINRYKYINLIWFASHALAMANSCCNPFIYAIYNDKFQREFRARLWGLKYLCGRSNEEDVLNYSDASDVDRTNTNLRASYRFKNSLSVRYNHKTSYNGNNPQRNQDPEIRKSCSVRKAASSPNKRKSPRNINLNDTNHRPLPRQSSAYITNECGESSVAIREWNGNCNNNVGSITTNPEIRSGPEAPAIPTTAIAVIAVDACDGGSCLKGAKTKTVVATEAECRL